MNVKRIAAAFLVASPIIGAPCQAYAAAQHAPAAKVDYSAVGALLKSVADREVAEKHIPSLSYAIVDADGIRLSGSAGFGQGLNSPTSSLGGKTVLDDVCASTGIVVPPRPLGPSLVTERST